jgi:hypothetical protein
MTFDVPPEGDGYQPGTHWHARDRLAQADLRVEHLYLPANLIEGGGSGDLAEDEPGPLLADAGASDRNLSLPQRLL